MLILKLVHAFLGLNAVVGGIVVFIRIISGHSFERWGAHFLGFSLATSVMGLVLSIHHTGLVQCLTMLSVYVSVSAVISWRKFKSNENWGTTLVLSTMGALCLNSIIVIVHIFKVVAICSMLGWPQPHLLFPISMAATVLLFAALSVVAVRRNPYGERLSVSHKVNR